MKKNMTNINELEWELDECGNFTHEEKRLGAIVNSEMLGSRLCRLMPGKKSIPYHYHYANEEAVFVLEGKGTLRMNNELCEISQGSYISFPIGPDYAHQLINTSDTPLVFLCISTMNHPDVVVYPDSDKVGVSTGAAPGADPQKTSFKACFRKADEADYFDGES
jgi:uncharacterized cupin superfamily protein